MLQLWNGRKKVFFFHARNQRAVDAGSIGKGLLRHGKFFRLVVIRSARRVVESVFMVESFLKVILNNKMREQLIALYRVYVNFTIECYLYKKLLGEINNSCANTCSLIL